MFSSELKEVVLQKTSAAEASVSSAFAELMEGPAKKKKRAPNAKASSSTATSGNNASKSSYFDD